MKTRYGFVSNSSSSSFIVRDMKTSEIAKKMVELIERDAQDWDEPHTCPCCGSKLEGTSEPNTETINALNFLKANPDFDDPICIPWSRNYETFIVRQTPDIVFVDTCNNHIWEEVLEYQYMDDSYNADMGTDYLDLSCLKVRTKEMIREEFYRRYE